MSEKEPDKKEPDKKEPDKKEPATPWQESELSGDLKENLVLSKYKTVAELGKAHIELDKAYNARHPGISKDDDWGATHTKIRNFMRMPQDKGDYKTEYKGPDKDFVESVAFKNSIHPKQITNFMNEYGKAKSNQAKDLKEAQVEEWKEQTGKKVFASIANKDELLGKAVNKLGFNLENFREELGDYSHHPLVNKMLISIAKSRIPEGKMTHTEPGKESEPENIQDKIDFLKLTTRDPSGPYLNESHPEHGAYVRKADKYARELEDYRQKTGKHIEV